MLNLEAMCLDVWKLSQMTQPLLKKEGKREERGREAVREGEREVDKWYKYEQMKCGQTWAINTV